jgi:hypothetical protein
MSSLLKKLAEKAYNSEDSSDDVQQEQPAAADIENKKPTVRKAVRGRTAALLAASDSDDDSDDDNCYAKKINQTKKEMKEIHNTLDSVDSKFIRGENTQFLSYADGIFFSTFQTEKLVIETKETEAKNKATRRQYRQNESSDKSDSSVFSNSDSDKSSDDTSHKDTKKKKIDRSVLKYKTNLTLILQCFAKITENPYLRHHCHRRQR